MKADRVTMQPLCEGTFEPDDEEALRYCWEKVGRPAQQPPPGDWATWLIMAGRGFGKTRAGAEWVRAIAERDGSARIALVAGSLHDARSVMVEGESGLLAIAPPGNRPKWFPTLRQLVWKSGALAMVYGAAEPDSLRGPQHHYAWADEIAKWPRGEAAWDNLKMTLRAGVVPQVVATTTPRPVPLVRRLRAEAERPSGPHGVIMTHGSTVDNAANLPAAFLTAMQASYGGTRLGRQELDGELIDDVKGALWSRSLLERCRVQRVPEMTRVVVGVDPPAGVGGDACGIVVVAMGEDDRFYVLADASVEGLSPEGWARAVARAAAEWSADRVIAEANNGGAMVQSVLLAAEANLPVRLVHASHGKAARAEPISTLYESGRALHAGAFPALEDEMCGLVAGGRYEGPGRSPDRADALVWAMSALTGRNRGEARVRQLVWGR